MKLKEKIAVITGAGAGIGKSTAILFCKEGAKVSCNSLSKSALKVSKEIRKFGGDAIFVQGDVSNEIEAENQELAALGQQITTQTTIVNTKQQEITNLETEINALTLEIITLTSQQQALEAGITDVLFFPIVP